MKSYFSLRPMSIASDLTQVLNTLSNPADFRNTWGDAADLQRGNTELKLKPGEAVFFLGEPKALVRALVAASNAKIKTTDGTGLSIAVLPRLPQNRMIVAVHHSNTKGKSESKGGSESPNKIRPGDYMMYMFQGVQYGGHTVNTILEKGDKVLHVSGNTGGSTPLMASELPMNTLGTHLQMQVVPYRREPDRASRDWTT